MNRIDAHDFKETMQNYRQAAQKWKIFFYPTDTIYWIWWVVSPESVWIIDEIKQRDPGKHYSIIAPSFKRITKYFKVDKNTLEAQWTERQTTHGGITVLMELKLWYDFNLVSHTNVIGVRIIDHWFQEFVEFIWQPFITTSMNTSGNPPAQKVDDIHEDHHEVIHLAIDEGKITGTPSVIIKYETGEVVARG